MAALPREIKTYDILNKTKNRNPIKNKELRGLLVIFRKSFADYGLFILLDFCKLQSNAASPVLDISITL